MKYRVLLLPRAARQLAALPSQTQDRLQAAILALGDNPRPPGCLKLQGRDGWRIRVGDYRIIYDIADEIRIVSVQGIAHRRESYR